MTENKQITLPEGVFNVNVDIFTEVHLEDLKTIYEDWRSLCDKLNKFNSRSVNLPEGLSEVAFCLFTNTYRLNNPKLGSGVSSSFDSYDPRTHKRIQIKACSVIPDLTSFGPNSVWDEIYFLDFYRNGKWEGKFDVYHIPNDLIYNQLVNKESTFQEFQKLGKRPRFSIYNRIITEKGIKPVATFDLYDKSTIINKLPLLDNIEDSVIIDKKGNVELE